MIRIIVGAIMLCAAIQANAADYQKGLDAFHADDYATALQEWRPLAEQGDASAQYRLGVMYANGRGVTANDAEAVKWYRKAAEQGYAMAQYNLGVMYDNGQGVTANDAEAVKWYRKAAEQTHASAQSNLGLMYANGRGVAANDAEAVKWFRKAAEQGNASAQSNLGLMYANGRGVAANDAEAVKWYRKAVTQGHASAQSNLGVMYANGRGVDKNMAWATYWSALAAQQGIASASDNLVYYRENLTQLSVDKPVINIRSKPSTGSDVVLKAKQGDIAYRLFDLDNGWYSVYLREGHTLGYSADFLFESASQRTVTSNTNSPYPARPAPQPGRTVCRTKCFNGDCYRTYADGRKVHFQARQKWDPINNTWTWDSGGC